jgi:hypothetical protein
MVSLALLISLCNAPAKMCEALAAPIKLAIRNHPEWGSGPSGLRLQTATSLVDSGCRVDGAEACAFAGENRIVFRLDKITLSYIQAHPMMMLHELSHIYPTPETNECKASLRAVKLLIEMTPNQTDKKRYAEWWRSTGSGNCQPQEQN